MKTILVTGAAGFIGANLVKRFFKEMSTGDSSRACREDSSRACRGTIVGIDNLNNYYDVSLKEYRLRELETLHSQLTLNSKPIYGEPVEPTLNFN